MTYRADGKLVVLILLPIAVVLGDAAPTVSGPPEGLAGSPRVAVFSRAQQSHREASSAICRDLRRVGYECVLIELPTGGGDVGQEQALQKLVEVKPTIVATGGTKATLLALGKLPDIPVVFFMVPNGKDAPFVSPDDPDRRRVAGVTTDIAPRDQLGWLTQLSSDVKRVAVLTSSRSKHTCSAIEAVGRKLAVTVVRIDAAKDDFMSAIDTLNASRCDAVLMIPDARVYNSLTVQRLLVWGIRHKKPICAFSPHIVKAGALTGQFCNNDAIGRQTAELIRQVIQGVDIASIGLRYPEHLSRAFNERTAELIGITLDQGNSDLVMLRYGSE